MKQDYRKIKKGAQRTQWSKQNNTVVCAFSAVLITYIQHIPVPKIQWKNKKNLTVGNPHKVLKSSGYGKLHNTYNNSTIAMQLHLHY